MEDIDFGHLRHTNDVPISHDRNIISAIISSIDSEISRVDESIAVLENELKFLKTKRITHVERRSDYARLLSPLRCMPLEILGEIFLYVVADYLPARLRVSHVCQLWRNAALATSELWFKIDANPWLPKTEQLLQDYVQACVHRAKSRHLNLNCREGQRFQPKRHDVLISIFKVTKTCQWKEFLWETMDFRKLENVVAIIAATSHNTLESLALHGDMDLGADYDDNAMQIKIRTKLNRLSRLSLILPGRFDPRNIDAPWFQLTNLSFTCVRMEEETILNILHQCSNIEECILNFFIDPSPSGIFNRPIHLDKLRTLSITSTGEDLFATIMHGAVTPVLQNLIMHWSEFDPDDSDFSHDEGVYQFLLSNAATLRRLWIHGAEERIKDIIIKLSLLEELTLVFNNDVDVDDFYALEVRPHYNRYDGPPYNPLPHLCALKFICDVSIDAHRAFFQIVNSRGWDAGEDSGTIARTRLRYASLQDIDTADFESSIDLSTNVARLKQRGLDINVLNPSREELTPSFKYFDQ